MFRKILSLRVGLPLPLAVLERPVSHGSFSNSMCASGLNLPAYDFSRIPRQLMVSVSTTPRLFGDARLSTAATTVFHGQWLVAWAVNPSPCTSQGLCAVSGRRLSADFRWRQHRLLATRPHGERRAALADHWYGRPSVGVTGGAHRQRGSRWGRSPAHPSPPATVCPGKANAISKTAKCAVDLAEPAAADGCPSGRA